MNKFKNVSFLVDASDDNGVSPDSWFNPNESMKIGYAGGLGEDNVVNQLNLIKSVATNNFWIDMESKIRNENDHFNISKINNILKLISF